MKSERNRKNDILADFPRFAAGQACASAAVAMAERFSGASGRESPAFDCHGFEVCGADMDAYAVRKYEDNFSTDNPVRCRRHKACTIKNSFIEKNGDADVYQRNHSALHGLTYYFARLKSGELICDDPMTRDAFGQFSDIEVFLLNAASYKHPPIVQGNGPVSADAILTTRDDKGGCTVTCKNKDVTLGEYNFDIEGTYQVPKAATKITYPEPAVHIDVPRVWAVATYRNPPVNDWQEIVHGACPEHENCKRGLMCMPGNRGARTHNFDNGVWYMRDLGFADPDLVTRTSHDPEGTICVTCADSIVPTYQPNAAGIEMEFPHTHTIAGAAGQSVTSVSYLATTAAPPAMQLVQEGVGQLDGPKPGFQWPNVNHHCPTLMCMSDFETRGVDISDLEQALRGNKSCKAFGVASSMVPNPQAASPLALSSSLLPTVYKPAEVLKLAPSMETVRSADIEKRAKDGEGGTDADLAYLKQACAQRKPDVIAALLEESKFFPKLQSKL